MVVVGLAFLLCGAVIMMLPLEPTAPSGSSVSCGNSLGMGFDALDVEERDRAFMTICERLRSERRVWGIPAVAGGMVLLAIVGARGRRFVNHSGDRSR